MFSPSPRPTIEDIFPEVLSNIFHLACEGYSLWRSDKWPNTPCVIPSPGYNRIICRIKGPVRKAQQVCKTWNALARSDSRMRYVAVPYDLSEQTIEEARRVVERSGNCDVHLYLRMEPSKLKSMHRSSTHFTHNAHHQLLSK